MSDLALATAFVIGSLWILDQLEVVPMGLSRTHLTRLAMLVIVFAMFVASPAAAAVSVAADHRS